MSYMIDKFKGVYRLKAPVDKSTNDFPRKINGSYEDIDVYIDCSNNNRIYHYSKNILQAYIPSIVRGHNILKVIDSIGNNLVFDILESDEEVIFKFKYNDSDKIIPLLKPKTSGANISPFSSKNLPKNKDYKIPDEDLYMYKNITSKIPPESILAISYITNNFIKSLATKKNPIENIKSDMRQKRLKPKEYIHSIGKWNEYIIFLKENL